MSHRQPSIVVALAAMTWLAVPATAQELGHYSPALADVRDLLQPPEPGFYFKQYT